MILIQNTWLEDRRVDLLIQNNRIAKITEAGNIELRLGTEAPRGLSVIDGSQLAVFPPLINMHTHSAMTLFRGYGDDLPLERWLNEKIWPGEARLTPELVYWGSKLACLEMIKSGTVCFNDMYFYHIDTARAVRESGMRAMLSLTCFDHFNDTEAQQLRHTFADFGAMVEQWPDDTLIQWAVAPHAVYTVSGATLHWLADFAREHHLHYHIHAAETLKECREAQSQFGYSPIRWLHHHGVLAENTIVAHGLWIDDDEVKLLGDNKVTVVHNPNSNLKLGSGHAFRYIELRQAGANVVLGTDGCSSSNNLDMVEAMKVMSLLQKGWRQDPLALPATEVLQVASANAYRTLGLDGGVIAEGRLADMILVDLNNVAMVPCHNALSNFVYAAHGDAVHTVICNGRILMQNHHVPGEETIIAEARRAARQLITS